jgi:hypothetical protein
MWGCCAPSSAYSLPHVGDFCRHYCLLCAHVLQHPDVCEQGSWSLQLVSSRLLAPNWPLASIATSAASLSSCWVASCPLFTHAVLYIGRNWPLASIATSAVPPPRSSCWVASCPLFTHAVLYIGGNWPLASIATSAVPPPAQQLLGGQLPHEDPMFQV